MPQSSTQEAYAYNLKGKPLGTAIYRPVLLLNHSRRVGDIGFFDREGRYKCIRNAFDVEVDHILHFLKMSLLTLNIGPNGVGLEYP